MYGESRQWRSALVKISAASFCCHWQCVESIGQEVWSCLSQQVTTNHGDNVSSQLCQKNVGPSLRSEHSRRWVRSERWKWCSISDFAASYHNDITMTRMMVMTKRGWCWCQRWWWWWWWCWWWRSWSCGPWVTATVRAHPLPPLSPSIKGIFLENWKLTSSQNTKGIVINTKHDTLDSTHIISNNDYIIPNNKETIHKEQSYIINKEIIANNLVCNSRLSVPSATNSVIVIIFCNVFFVSLLQCYYNVIVMIDLRLFPQYALLY